MIYNRGVQSVYYGPQVACCLLNIKKQKHIKKDLLGQILLYFKKWWRNHKKCHSIGITFLINTDANEAKLFLSHSKTAGTLRDGQYCYILIAPDGIHHYVHF